MNNITPINNVLMQPIQWNGQVYFTSHYFHQQYRMNSGDEGKYEQLKDFNRLIRSIETYPKYVERSDIVELTKAEASAEFASAFKATFGNPIMLINATAQIALTHHLDDEISKQVSVAANEQTAKQTSSASNISNIAKDFKGMCQLAEMFELRGNKGLLAANDWAHRKHGVNIMGELGIKSLKCEEQEPELTGTELGNRAGIPGNGTGKAQNVNLALWELGYLKSVQSGKSKGWEISEKGLSSGHVQYDNMAKANGKRSSMQVIVYQEALVNVLKEAGAAEFDFKALKKKRAEQKAA